VSVQCTECGTIGDLGPLSKQNCPASPSVGHRLRTHADEISDQVEQREEWLDMMCGQPEEW